MRRRLAILIGGLSLIMLVSNGGAATYRTASLFCLSLAIMAGLHVVTGLTRSISLCHAALVGVGAYAGALTSLRLHAWPFASLAAGALVAGSVAYLLAWVTRRLEEHYLAFATLACSEILTNIFRGATSVTGGANGLTGVPPLSVLGVPFNEPARYFWVTLFIGFGSLLFVRAIDRSATGRALRAYGDQGLRVESLGVSAPMLRVLGFTVGGMIAGLGGATVAHLDGFVGPESYGVGLSIAYLCYLVIGGLGWLPGLFVAAFFASVAPELFRGLVAWQMVIVSALAILVLYARSDFAQRAITAVRQPAAGAPRLFRVRDPS